MCRIPILHNCDQNFVPYIIKFPLKLDALKLFGVALFSTEYEYNRLVHILYANNFIFFYAKVLFMFFINIIVVLAILKLNNHPRFLIVFNYAHLSYIVVKNITTYLNPVNDTKLVFYCIVL